MAEEKTTPYKVPESLESVKAALPAALMYLAKGERPTQVPQDEKKSMRFALDAQAEIYIGRLTPEFGSRTQVITHALAWVAERSDREKLMLINTKI